MLKHLKWQEICSAIILAAIGGVLIFRPEVTMELLTKAIGILLIVIGAVFVLSFFLRRVPNIDNNNLVSGVVIIGIGIFVYMKQDLFVSFIPMLLGIGIVISGIFKLQRGFEIRRMHIGGWAWVAVLGLINILLGTLILLNPSVIAKILMQLVGGALIFSGLFDLITTLVVSRKFSRFIVEGKAEPIAPASYDDPEMTPAAPAAPEDIPSAPWEETDL